MDYITQRRLANAFSNLDRALARRDRIAADLARYEINRMLEESPPEKDERSFTDGLPRWVRDLIADQGLRVPALERALDAQKVVVSPTFGKGRAGVQIEIRF